MTRLFIFIVFLLFSANLSGAENITSGQKSNLQNTPAANTSAIKKVTDGNSSFVNKSVSHISRPLDSYQTDNQEKKQPESPDKSWWYKLRTDPVATFTFLLFVATGLLWWSTRQLVLGAEKTAEKELRAYVFVDSTIDYFDESSNVPAFIVDIELTNYGKTPAIIRDATAKIIKDGKIQVVEGIENIKKRGYGIPQGTIIGNSEPISRTFEIRDNSIINIDDFKKIKTGKMKFLFGVAIVYEDIMKNRRETAFFFEYNSLTNAIYLSNEDHNYYT